jgi:APA family basic amino acid/polyamine antiporter
MARDGVFFPAAAHVHPHFKTPHMSIIWQAAWTSILIATGSLDALSNYVGFAITLFAGIAVAAVFVLRARDPHAPRPYRTLGYPIAPAIFVFASLAIVLNAFYRNPGPSGLGLLVIASGIPLYVWLTRGR